MVVFLEKGVQEVQKSTTSVGGRQVEVQRGEDERGGEKERKMEVIQFIL